MTDKGLVCGLDLNEKVTFPECETCVEATMTNGPMKSRTLVTSVSGTLIYTDVAEIYVMSLGSAKYFVVLIDEASLHVCAAQLKSEGDTAANFEKYVKWMERQTGSRVQRIGLAGERSI